MEHVFLTKDHLVW